MSRAGGPSPRLVLVAASAAQAAIAFVTFGLPSIGPELAREYDLTLSELGAVLTAGLLGAGLVLVVAGMAVDRFGARWPSLVGTALAASALLAAAASASKVTLFVALVLSGVGASVIPIAGSGAIFLAYPPRRRGWALGVRQMSVPLGGMIAAVAIPWVTRHGGVGAALALSALLIAITGAVFGLTAPTALPPPARRAARPLRTIWGAAGMQRLLVIAALYIVVLQAAVAYSVPAMRDSGLTALAASVVYFTINVSAMVARVVWGHVADRNEGERRTRALVDVGIVAGAGAVLFLLSLSVGLVAVVAVAAVIFGFGALGWNGLVYLSAGERAAPELAARSVAVAATVVYLLSALSAPALGALAGATGWTPFWLVVAALAAVGAAVSATLPRAAAQRAR